MKKIFMWMLAVTLMCGTTAVVSSCDDDDVEDVLETVNLVGKWTSTGQVTPNPGNKPDFDFDGTIEFKSNGTVVSTDSENHSLEGTWTLRGKVLTVTISDEGEQVTSTYNIQEGWTRDRMVMTTVVNIPDSIGKSVAYTITVTLNRVK